jgi:ppGpp synthetase/RelA/SpoT-type nucleotidyltranferase
MTNTAADDVVMSQLIAEYESESVQNRLQVFRKQVLAALEGSAELKGLVHTYTSRLKDPDHLRDKLRRKMQKCAADGTPFDVTPENLLTAINDLVGIRLLHLYTMQVELINASLLSLFEELQYEVIEGPFARTWDDESREFFRGCGIATQESPSMYTSVHYVIGSASRTKLTCEVQVRTLMEEVWGEVDHALNYPVQSTELAITEQLKVLARVTSSASRLVDSIFRSNANTVE